MHSMTLLTVNAGSTSVKLALFELDQNRVPQRARAEAHPSHEDPHAILSALKHNGPSGISTVVHRVVHGGDQFSHPCTLNPPTITAIEALSALAPLHNPAALRWIRAARELWPAAPHVAVFDTALFRNLPRVAAEYALPARLGSELGVRRYGFHG